MARNIFARETPDPHRGPKPPPNYASRGVQFRVMILVCSLMLVVVLMYESRKPENWLWMGFEQTQQAEGEAEAAIDSRHFISDDTPEYGNGLSGLETGQLQVDLGPRETKPDETSTGLTQDDDFPRDDVDTNLPPGDSAEIVRSTGVSSQAAGAEEIWTRTRKDYWTKAFDALDGEQRTVLYLGLRDGRDAKRIGSSNAEVWRQIMTLLEARRSDYETQVLRSLTELGYGDDEKKRLWSAVLADLQQEWRLLHPALLAIGGDTASVDVDPASANGQSDTTTWILDELQQILDEITLGRIEDDAIASSRGERQIWYRQFERLRSMISVDEVQQRLEESDQQVDALAEVDAEARIVDFQKVGFLQLFEQPGSYRGQAVRIEGEIKLAERQPASKNTYGIDEYHVFWIRPKGKANLPIVVYALERPAGFPAYESDGRVAFGQNEGQPVVVNGVFFKRRAYQAQDGLRRYPLILAKGVNWTPREVEVASQNETPGMSAWFTVVLCIACCGYGIARLAIWHAGRKTTSRFVMPNSEEFEPASLEKLEPVLNFVPEDHVEELNRDSPLDS